MLAWGETGHRLDAMGKNLNTQFVFARQHGNRLTHRALELRNEEHCPIARYRFGRVLGRAWPRHALEIVCIVVAVFRFLVDPYPGRCGLSCGRRRCYRRNASLLSRFGAQRRPRQIDVLCDHDCTGERDLCCHYCKGHTIYLGALVDST